MRYIKEVFDVTTLEYAKHVVLTSDPSNPYKFEKETQFLIDVISEQNFIALDEKSVVFDFGCGMGRVAKGLIDTFNCKVIGLDISPSMLAFAKTYTNSNKFECTQEYSIAESADVGIAILSLQHTENPKKEIDNIVNVIKTDGIFILVNEHKRFVPSDIDKNNYVIWSDDGFDIFSYVESKLKLVKKVHYLNSDVQILFYKKEL